MNNEVLWLKIRSLSPKCASEVLYIANEQLRINYQSGLVAIFGLLE